MDKEKKTDALDIVKWLAVVMVAIWVVWYLTGGPARYERESGILLKPPSPLSTGQTYGKIPNVKLKLPDTTKFFLEGGKGVIGARNNLRLSDPQNEYFEIVGQNDTPIDITGWKLVGKNGANATIGQGTSIFRAGQINQLDDIYIKNGGVAVIISGNSPIGYSFQTNSCSGYLAQFENFTPKLIDICQSIIPDETQKKAALDNSCLNYINKMSSCFTPTKTLPSALSATCHEFILTHASYNSCVDDYKNSANFYGNEWRVYLNSDKELWGDHDTIKFYDADKNLIGIYSY